MSRFFSSLALALGAWSLGTAARRYLDLGTLLPDSVFLVALGVGVLGLAIGLARGTGPAEPVRSTAAEGLGVALLILWAWLDSRTWPLVAGGLGALALMAPPVLSGTLLRTGCVLLLAWASVLLLDAASLWRVSLTALDRCVAFVLETAGTASGWNEHGLVYLTARGFRHTTSTLHQFGAAALVILAVALAFKHGLGRSTLGTLLRGLCLGLAVLAGAVARALTLVLVAAFQDGQAEFDSDEQPITAFNDWLVTSGIDAVGVLVALLAYAALTRPWPALPVAPLRQLSPRLALSGVLLAALAGLGLGFERSADALGTREPGRLLIDEAHSKWEPTDAVLGRDTYGQESGYNFRVLVDWLAEGYGAVQRNYEPITAESLADVRVLVLKTPTDRYAPAERTAILDFVRAGGGLLLIGDHTNVFGTGEVLNEFGRELGFRLEFDSVFDQRQTFEHVYRRDSHLALHPILRRVPKMRFEVGCSIDLEDPAWRPVIVGRGLKNLLIDWKASNFYPSVNDGSAMRFGQLCELATRAYGDGRVALLSDSTLLSTFSVMYPGRRELVEGMVDWLSHDELGESPRRFGLWVGISAGLAALLLLRRSGNRPLLLALGAACGTATLARVIAERAVFEPAPSIHTRTTERNLHFWTASDTAFWPVDQFVREHERAFSIFFQWTMRVGAYPRFEPDLDRALLEARTLIMIDPPDIPEERLRELINFAEAGGSLLALQSQDNATIARLAAATGSPLGAARPATRLESLHGPVDLGGTIDLPSVEGATSLLTASAPDTDESFCVLGTRSLGQGRLILATIGALVTDQAFGARYHVIPDEQRRRLFEMEFDLFAWLLESGTAPGGSQ